MVEVQVEQLQVYQFQLVKVLKKQIALHKAPALPEESEEARKEHNDKLRALNKRVEHGGIFDLPMCSTTKIAWSVRL